MSHQSPRIVQGRMRLGPAVLRTFPLASPRSQVRVRLGLGGYCRHSGYGGTQTCPLAAHCRASSTAWYGPASASMTQDPREGPNIARQMMPRPPRGSASSGWLPRRGDFYARCTSRGLADVSHDDQGQAGASGCRMLVSSLMQMRQAPGAVSRGINQRFPFWCKKTKTTRTTGRRSSLSPPQRHD